MGQTQQVAGEENYVTLMRATFPVGGYSIFRRSFIDLNVKTTITMEKV
jgi:hypothetical protein